MRTPTIVLTIGLLVKRYMPEAHPVLKLLNVAAMVSLIRALKDIDPKLAKTDKFTFHACLL